MEITLPRAVQGLLCVVVALINFIPPHTPPVCAVWRFVYKLYGFLCRGVLYAQPQEHSVSEKPPFR